MFSDGVFNHRDSLEEQVDEQQLEDDEKDFELFEFQAECMDCENIEDITYYIILMSFAGIDVEDYKVKKRFSDFVELNETLSRRYRHKRLPPLPRKTFFWKRYDDAFITQRKNELHEYCQRITNQTYLRNTECVWDFFELANNGVDPNIYRYRPIHISTFVCHQDQERMLMPSGGNQQISPDVPPSDSPKWKVIGGFSIDENTYATVSAISTDWFSQMNVDGTEENAGHSGKLEIWSFDTMGGLHSASTSRAKELASIQKERDAPLADRDFISLGGSLSGVGNGEDTDSKADELTPEMETPDGSSTTPFLAVPATKEEPQETAPRTSLMESASNLFLPLVGTRTPPREQSSSKITNAAWDTPYLTMYLPDAKPSSVLYQVSTKCVLIGTTNGEIFGLHFETSSSAPSSMNMSSGDVMAEEVKEPESSATTSGDEKPPMKIVPEKCIKLPHIFEGSITDLKIVKTDVLSYSNVAYNDAKVHELPRSVSEPKHIRGILLVAGANCYIGVFELSRGICLGYLQTSISPNRAIAYCRGRFFVGNNEKNLLQFVHNQHNGTPIPDAEIGAHDGATRRIISDEGSGYVFTAGYDNHVLVWKHDKMTNRFFQVQALKSVTKGMRITSLCLMKSVLCLAIAHDNGCVTLWKAHKLENTKKIRKTIEDTRKSTVVPPPGGGLSAPPPREEIPAHRSLIDDQPLAPPNDGYSEAPEKPKRKKRVLMQASRKNWRCWFMWRAHRAEIQQMTWNEDTNLLITSGLDGLCRIFYVGDPDANPPIALPEYFTDDTANVGFKQRVAQSFDFKGDPRNVDDMTNLEQYLL